MTRWDLSVDKKSLVGIWVFLFKRCVNRGGTWLLVYERKGRFLARFKGEAVSENVPRIVSVSGDDHEAQIFLNPGYPSVGD